MRDAFTGEVIGGSMSIVGQIVIANSKKMPGDDSIARVDASAGIALNNPYSAHINGGGTNHGVDQAGPLLARHGADPIW